MKEWLSGMGNGCQIYEVVALWMGSDFWVRIHQVSGYVELSVC